MSPASATACKWTCHACGVSVSRIDGSPAPLPNSWASESAGDFCLACRRQRAAEAALTAAPSASSRDARAKLRRTGLIEFEVRRMPERTNGSIAKTCRASAAAVAAARRRLQLPEAPAAGSDHRPAPAQRRLAGRP